MRAREVASQREWFVKQGLETIRNRVDQFGVTEPSIQQQGDNRILVQLPGVQDPERAKALIGKTALLEFKLVNDGASGEQAVAGARPTGADVANARLSIDQNTSEPYVSLELTGTGGRVFSDLTSANVGRRLAIVLDGSLYSAPVIRERIPSGQAQITGGFTSEEAPDLALVLRAGALPAPVQILEERSVGPSLGADSIRKGVVSSAAAAIPAGPSL